MNILSECSRFNAMSATRAIFLANEYLVMIHRSLLKMLYISFFRWFMAKSKAYKITIRNAFLYISLG